jgi:hypothetical protein
MHVTKQRDLCYCIAAIAFGNFILFIIISQFLGGTDPHAVNGHYYLNEHGRFTEVSRTVYQYIRIHFWLSLLLVFVGAFALRRGRALQREIGDYDPVISRSI